MNKNEVVLLIAQRYRMEPGDGTRYEFSITDWGLIGNHQGAGRVVSGIGTGKDYVTLTIHPPLGVGSFEVCKGSLRDPHIHFLRYLKGHGFSQTYDYTLAAVVLAAGVLVDEPENLEKAAAAMLRAPELLEER